MPSVVETESSYLDYIIRSEDSVVKHWLKSGASGFRLDVADELPDEFLEALRAAVKKNKAGCGCHRRGMGRCLEQNLLWAQKEVFSWEAAGFGYELSLEKRGDRLYSS